MHKTITVILHVLAVLLTASNPTFAGEHPDNGTISETCPPGFDHAHQVHDGGAHDDAGHGEHRHVGNDKDQNSDGYVCVKHAGKDGNTHVHADNNYRRGH